MTRPPARETLKIILGGEEVPGLIAYGLRRRHDPAPARFPTNVWTEQPKPTVTLYGEAWEVLMWQVPINIWPPPLQMEAALRATMSALIEAGSPVAWIGAEGSPFSDPPDLFDPNWMSGAVLAWMTDTGPVIA